MSLTLQTVLYVKQAISLGADSYLIKPHKTVSANQLIKLSLLFFCWTIFDSFSVTYLGPIKINRPTDFTTFKLCK